MSKSFESRAPVAIIVKQVRTSSLRFCDSLIAIAGEQRGLKENLSSAAQRQVEAELEARGYRLAQRSGKWFAEKVRGAR